jgi:23S rRNA maturation-related 3'-5' exoribonuclease YhaM
MDRISIFQTELNLIKNESIRKFTEEMLKNIPEYFFSIPASSTGKYHPNYALGDGGLVRHTKAAVHIANSMLGLEMMKYSDDEKDIVISALILHDGCKSGLNHTQFTVTEHPTVETSLIKTTNSATQYIDENTLNTIIGCIESHMGEWNYDRYKKEVLPKPKTKLQNVTHLADYLASRKFLEVNFDVIK